MEEQERLPTGRIRQDQSRRRHFYQDRPSKQRLRYYLVAKRILDYERFLTRYAALECWLYKIGKGEDQNCRLCQEDPEATKHILCECAAISRTRHQHFIPPTQFQDENRWLILRFIKQCHGRQMFLFLTELQKVCLVWPLAVWLGYYFEFYRNKVTRKTLLVITSICSWIWRLLLYAKANPILSNL